MKLKRIVLFSLLAFGPIVLVAQNVSGTYNRTPLEAFIEETETKTPYRFYFEKAWVDTLKVTASFTNVPVSDALQLLLKGTHLQYFVRGHQVILTNNVPVLTGLDLTEVTMARNYSFSREFQPTTEAAEEAPRVIEVGRKEETLSGQPVALRGHIREKRSGEPIPGAYVYVENPQRGISTDNFGFYTLLLKPGAYELRVQFTGMKTEKRSLILYNSGDLDLFLNEDIVSLKEVTIESERETNISGVQMGTSLMDIKSMKNVPKVFGENDVIKVALTMPGVKNMGEGSAGISVRGGNMDQNLMTISDATVYNPNHFLGFFSIFNADAIKSSELYKSGFPAQYGGRLSSIMDIQLKDGNKNKFSAMGGISPVTTQLTAEIPLIKERTSLILGGRTTYSDWILRTLPVNNLKSSEASFYDYFVRVSHQVDAKNSVHATWYGSRDKFRLTPDSLFAYNNQAGSLQWRHTFKGDIQSVAGVSYSGYQYTIRGDQAPETSFDIGFKLQETAARWDLIRYRDRHKTDAGLAIKRYGLEPGYIRPVESASTVISKELESEQGIEYAAYLADNFEISPAFSLYAGLRFSMFTALGPRTISSYQPNAPRNGATLASSQTYGSGESIITYSGIEPRFSLRYNVGSTSSIKLNYARTRQYIHMLSNTVSISPTNTWKLSDPNIAPQVADQISIGYYRNFNANNIETSMEVYYKEMQRVLDYKVGSSLLLNDHIEQDVLQGNGQAYGLEIMLRKKTGKANGWISYTYSRTLMQLSSAFKEETINQGNWFPANYDRPHSLNVVFNYRITRRYSFSGNFTYSSGRPITYPVGVYKLGDIYQINYSDRNAFRIPDYVRLDVGFNIEGNHKIKKLAHGFWTISIYNVLGRHNPYSVYFTVKDGVVSANQLSIFGAPIPTITYNFRF